MKIKRWTMSKNRPIESYGCDITDAKTHHVKSFIKDIVSDRKAYMG